MVFSANNSILSSPRLRPLINNPSTVKLPLSIQWVPTPQSCLPSGISSLLAPSPPCYKQRDIEEGRVPGGINTAGKVTLRGGRPLD
jgi:hypothetical protein